MEISAIEAALRARAQVEKNGQDFRSLADELEKLDTPDAQRAFLVLTTAETVHVVKQNRGVLAKHNRRFRDTALGFAVLFGSVAWLFSFHVALDEVSTVLKVVGALMALGLSVRGLTA